jgi:hypothetical protein
VPSPAPTVDVAFADLVTPLFQCSWTIPPEVVGDPVSTDLPQIAFKTITGVDSRRYRSSRVNGCDRPPRPEPTGDNSAH